MTQASPHEPSLRERALRAGVWTLGAHGFDLVVKLISNLVMTRLLFPEAFGMVAAATALTVGLGLISDFGVRAVIIQSSLGEQDDFLRSAWVFQLWRGFVLWIILAVLCALISTPAIHGLFPVDSVFADRSFPLITAAMGFAFVLSGAESTAAPLNLRRLNLKPIVLLDVSGRILPLPIMIIWASIVPSVWALVGGGLAGSILRLILSHAMVPGPRMALRWDKDHIHKIVHFGKWIAVSSMASFVSQQSDIILFGLLLPSSELGVYAIAKLLVNTAEGLLERLVASLALPILGEVIRKDRRNLRDRYYRFRLPIDLVAGLLAGVLLVTGNLIVAILYDPRYSQAGSVLQMLALGLAIYPFHLIRSAFTATGDTRIVAGVSIVQAASLIVCMVIGSAVFGTAGAIAGVAIHRLVPSAVIMFLARRRNWISVWHELRTIPIFIAGIIIGEGMLMLSKIFNITEIRHFWHQV
jgi:O-antigen/teichoic acid export membrane protein